MIPLHMCEDIPSSAPTLDKVHKSKSKKVFKLYELHFFITETKDRGIEIYSIELGKRLLQTFNGKNKALEFLYNHIDDVRGLIK